MLEKVCNELAEVFGTDPDPAVVRDKLLTPGGEELIHRMTYKTAVIKDVLRLHPPAGTARMAPLGSGFTVQTLEGQTLCVDGMILYNCATIIQRDRAVFGDSADDFVPERWLGDSDVMSTSEMSEGLTLSFLSLSPAELGSTSHPVSGKHTRPGPSSSGTGPGS